MRYVLVALALALSVSNASAKEVRTFGASDCGQWFTEGQYPKIWLLGYLSGINAADRESKVDVLARLNSSSQAFLWMDSYCKANPLKTVGDGAIDLYVELRNQK